MWVHRKHPVAMLLGLAFGTMLLQGCTDEKIVYRDAERFNPPPDESSGMLGYFDPATKETTCGQCHVGVQAQWEETDHADAYATLEASGHAQAFCYGCHAVSENGATPDDPAGWNVVQADAYHDVQCENCHGAGLSHVENPDDVKPIASLGIPETLDDGCAECHSGNHHPFAEEWSMSAHASVVGFAAGREECAGCHRGQGALEAWGVEATYLEQDSAEHMAVTCGVCHDPHGSPNSAQLRFPIDTPSAETHLCARCHNRRSLPDAGSSHGLEPHSPETALLLGDAGWFPPGLEPGAVIATHGSEANTGLCASCHVNRFEINDAETGEFVFQATGHLFTAVPCVDGTGIPMPGDCDYTTTDRSFLACATTGCHGTPAVAASLLNAQMANIEMWADDLLAALTLVDSGLDTPGGEIDPTDPGFNVAEGAYFNYNLALHGGNAAGATAHNPFLVEGLLLASITAVEDTYGVRANPAIDYERELARLMDRAGH